MTDDPHGTDEPLTPELARIATALHAAGPLVAPSDALTARVLAIPDTLPDAAAEDAGATPLRRRRRSALPWQLATGALAVVATVLAVLLWTRGPEAPEAQVVGQLSFQTNTAAGATSTGAAVLERSADGSQTVRISVRDLEPTPDGFYQLWISRDPNHRIAIGAFQASADGTIEANAALPPLDEAWKAVWLTREPADGDPGWTQDWVVKGKFT